MKKAVAIAFYLASAALLAGWGWNSVNSEGHAGILPPREPGSEPGPVAQALRSDQPLLEEIDAAWSGYDSSSAAGATGTKSNQSDPAMLSDAAWDRLPRSRWGFVGRVLQRPDSITANELFRHVLLNPLDVYIDPSNREVLRQLIASYGAKIATAQATVTKAKTKEFSALQAAGLTEPWKHSLISRNGRARAFFPFLPGNEGKVTAVSFDASGQPHGGVASRDKMPVTVAAENYLRFVTTEMGGLVVNWFSAVGACSPSMARELVTKLFE